MLSRTGHTTQIGHREEAHHARISVPLQDNWLTKTKVNMSSLFTTPMYYNTGMVLEPRTDIRLEYGHTRWEIAVNTIQTPHGASETNPVYCETASGPVRSRACKPQLQHDDFRHGAHVHVSIAANDVIPRTLKDIILHYQDYAGALHSFLSFCYVIAHSQ